MKIGKNIFKYYNQKGYVYYSIRYEGKAIASRNDYDEICEIYSECEDAEWDEEKLWKIKEKYSRINRKHEMKHIGRDQAGFYFIQRFKKYWGGSWDKNEAIKMRDRLDEIDWDESRWKYKKKIKRKSNLPKYIRKTQSGKYAIYYKQKSYGTFKDLKVAVEERDLLINSNWTYDFIDMV